MMKEYELVMHNAITNVITDESVNYRIAQLRFNSLIQILEILKLYEKEQFDPTQLLLPIAVKKTTMILNNSSKKIMEYIVKPAKPFYNGSEIVSGPYSVDEEEMIMWSRTSLIAPLIPDAQKRYMKLFATVFPVEYTNIIGG